MFEQPKVCQELKVVDEIDSFFLAVFEMKALNDGILSVEDAVSEAPAFEFSVDDANVTPFETKVGWEERRKKGFAVPWLGKVSPPVLSDQKESVEKSLS
mgnify:CR=1 FL=1